MLSHWGLEGIDVSPLIIWKEKLIDSLYMGKSNLYTIWKERSVLNFVSWYLRSLAHIIK